ncbi:MAG: ABC transporter permease subunit [Spirochaetales bacterium]|nr:ABC transporter permease subunit [Spirochaetales bacterium]
MAVGKDLILPGPVSVIKALWSLVRQGSFWTSILMTVLRIMLGYAAGVALGCLLAFGCCRSRILDSLFSPIIRMVRATPVASFIILAMLWMSKGGVPVLMSALIVAPVVWGNLTEAYSSRDPALDEMAAAYRLGKWKHFRFILVPQLMPSLRAACLTGLGFAWKSGIAAEVLSQPKLAIGSNIYYSKVYLETSELFAWTASVIALSFALEILVRKLIARRKSNED